METNKIRIWEYEGVNEGGEGRAEWEEDGIWWNETED